MLLVFIRYRSYNAVLYSSFFWRRKMSRARERPRWPAFLTWPPPPRGWPTLTTPAPDTRWPRRPPRHSPDTRSRKQKHCTKYIFVSLPSTFSQVIHETLSIPCLVAKVLARVHCKVTSEIHQCSYLCVDEHLWLVLPSTLINDHSNARHKFIV